MDVSKHSGESINYPDPSTISRIEWVPIELMRKNPRNARTHSQQQINKIRESIRTPGFLNPLLVDESNTLLAGHGRLTSALLEGFSHVPVIRFSHLSEAQKRAYLIADNKIAQEAGWDREMLAIELGELIELLPAWGMDVSLTGFDTPEIDLILADISSEKPAPEDVQLAPANDPVSRPGELWLLGKHRLLNGDAQDPVVFERLMNGKNAAAGFCDPPYNRDSRSIGGRGRIRHGNFAFASGEMSGPQFRNFLKTTLANGVAVLSQGAVQFICMDWQSIGDLIRVGAEIYDAMLNLVVWNKTNAGQGYFYRSQHEHIAVYRVGALDHKNNIQQGRFGRNRSNVWTYPGVNSFGKDRTAALTCHPTVKPLALVADAMLDCTARNDIVLDQFCGSGTTLVAAEKVGRIGFGIEYEPKFVDVAIRRWQKFTGLDAILDGDGRTFGQIARERSSGPDKSDGSRKHVDG